MKVGIPTDSGMVATHFGRCPEFTFVEIEGNKVKSKDVVENPGHKPGYIPQFMSENNVDCIITGGIGRKAINIFDDLGIKVISGVNGEVENVIEQFLEGDIDSGENLCEPGNGKH